MATFPPTVAQPGTGIGTPAVMAGGPPATGSPSPELKLALLSQAIQGLAADFPQGQQYIKQMMDALRGLQGTAVTQGAQPQPAAPPI